MRVNALRAGGRGIRHAARVDLGYADGRYHANSQTNKLPFGGGGEAFRKRCQHARQSIEQQDPRLLGMDGAEIVAQRIVGDLGQGSGEFHASGPRADNHKSQPAAAGLGIGLSLSGLEGVEDFVAYARRVFQRLEARRVGFPRVFVTEVEMPRSGSDDQRVVRDRRSFVQDQTATGRVQVDGIGEQDLGVFLFAQQDPQRRGDFARRQRACGHLVEQGLEKMEVASIHQGYGDVFVLKGSCCV